jgi:hypothetical protein
MLIWLVAWPLAAQPTAIEGRHIIGDLPPGPAREVLPATGALVHLQIHDVLSVLEGIEEILVSAVPEKLLPPDGQGLFRTEHPILTLVGMQALQQPLTPDVFREQTGLDPRGTATLTLYLGDPRRMFILGLPGGSRDPLARLASTLLRPSAVEEVKLAGHDALRVVSPRLPFDLHLVASETTLYVCGDRSLAIALFDAPMGERMGRDSFLGQALPAQDTHQLRLVLNPASVKPFALQLQAVNGIAAVLIPQQRQQLLDNLPAEAREQIELQVQSQLGLTDLEQFADYAECFLLATLEQLTDSITSRAAAFEGLTITGNLKSKTDQFSIQVHSQRLQPGVGTAPIPMDEVRRALAWLGPDYQSFSVTGRKAEKKQLPILTAWAQRVVSKCKSKGLDSDTLAGFVDLLQSRSPIPTVESRAPWTLSVQAPLRPLPPLDSKATVSDYLSALELPVWRPAKLIPARDPRFLESLFQAETDALNQNRGQTMDFFSHFRKQRPLLTQVHRFDTTAVEHDVTRYVRESAWITRGGLFGYDQHELVNRKIVWARPLDGYLIYHQGAEASPWLASLKRSNQPGPVPGVGRLLNHVPEGASYVSVNRVLVGLPALVDWIDTLELQMHREVEQYLANAQTIVDQSPELDQARSALRRLPMPLLIGSLNVEPMSRKVYALLPTGEAALTLPRARLAPLLKELLDTYASQASETGGSVAYTKTKAGSREFSVVQNWEALTALTRTFGNNLADLYLHSQEGQQSLHRKLAAPRDMDPTVFDEVIARNPAWLFVPQPHSRTAARLDKELPPRSATTPERMVDLSAYYNGALDETWQQGGLADNSLRDLPTGVQTLDGITFDIRGVVQLSGAQAARELSVRFPTEVSGIPVGIAATKIHFLHACAWQSPQGTTIGHYTIHFANGEAANVPIVYGTHVQDWWLAEPVTDPSGLRLAWQGQNHAMANGPSVGLYRSTWDSSQPDQRIVSIDYHSAMANSAPFLIAITVE